MLLLRLLVAGCVLLCIDPFVVILGADAVQDDTHPANQMFLTEILPGPPQNEVPGRQVPPQANVPVVQEEILPPEHSEPDPAAAEPEGVDAPSTIEDAPSVIEVLPAAIELSPAFYETEKEELVPEPDPILEPADPSISHGTADKETPVRKRTWKVMESGRRDSPRRTVKPTERSDGMQTGPFGMKTPVYRYPEERLQDPWRECRRSLENSSFPEVKSSLNRLYEARLDTGFPNASGVAALLVREGYRVLERGDLSTAKVLGQSAHDLAPDFFPVSVFLSRLAEQDSGQGWRKELISRWKSLKQRGSLFSWQYGVVGKLYLLLFLACWTVFFFLAPYFLFRYGTLFMHALRERMKPGARGRLQIVALCLLGVTLLILLPGLLWVVVIAGILMGRFLRRWEQVLFFFTLLFLALSPFTLGQAARFLSPLPAASRVLCECIQEDWDASCDRDLDTAQEAHPDSEALFLTRALVEKRRGEYARASKILEEALARYPEQGPLWNNMGNLYAFQGDLASAKAAYSQAIRFNTAIASPHYNLSQLLRREFSFIEGGRAFQEARRIDPVRVDYFAYIHSLNANRFFMDESPSTASCWRYALEGDGEKGSTPAALWALAGSGVPLGWTPWIFGALAAAFLPLAWNRRRLPVPMSCTGCGIIVCNKCHSGTAMTKMCTQCYQALYQGQSIPNERRNLQIRKMARSRASRFRRLLLLNALFPGLGFSVYEDRVSGFLMFFLFLFLALAGLFWDRLLPVPVVAWETPTPTSHFMIFSGLLILYVLVQARFFQKLRSGR